MVAICLCSPPHWPNVKACSLREVDTKSNSTFPWGGGWGRGGGGGGFSRLSHTSDFKIATQEPALPGAGITGSVLGLVGLVSVCCDQYR